MEYVCWPSERKVCKSMPSGIDAHHGNLPFTTVIIIYYRHFLVLNAVVNMATNFVVSDNIQ